MALVKDAWDEEYDIVKGSIHPSKEALGYELAETLAYKGFCVVDSGIGFDELDIAAALDDAKENLDTKFDPLPTEVVDGILGDSGTARVAELCPPSRVGEDGANLGKLDSFMTDMLHGLVPYMSSKLGFTSNQRTLGMVIQGGTAAKKVALTEKVCAKWLNTYFRQKLMVLFFLGPGEGTLELQPYDGESAPEELTTKPGMLVILRSDVIGVEHFSTGENYTLGCFALGPNLTGGRGARNELKGLAPVNKNIEVLTQWAMNKVLDIKIKQVADGDLAVWNDDIPRGWERAMNHIYQTGYPVAIRGVACKEPITHNPEAFWGVLSAASDLVIEVPAARWDHSQFFDPEPESYRKSNFVDRLVTNVKHACFMDGLELFDTKFFNISPAESKGMDPQQRLVLETSYESLNMAGFAKKQLMNAYIGVFGGSTNPEWANVPMEMGALSGTGCSEAIFCNRVSFCLGMQGPSTTIDCEMASASCAIYVACAQVAPANARHAMAGLDTPASLASGGYCMMVANYWPRFNYWMNPVGRCLTYDESAAGYVRGEMVGTLCIKPFLDTVDGQKVMSEEPCLGIPAGYRMNNNGKNTSMQAPSAPSEQESIFEVLRQAKISYLDVDAVEGHGTGQLLHDAVEVGATSKALRGKVGGDKDALMLNSVKTQVGAQCEACGMSQAFRVIYSQLHGVNLKNLHMKTLNPHIDLEDRSVVMNTEMMGYRGRSSYHMQIARGFGGTNCNITWWNKSDQERCPVDRPSLQKEVFAFWPAGGGALEFDATPSQGYTIVGSWSEWDSAEAMYQDSETCYSAVVTLGSSCCESFQIYIDGDPARVLHPGLVSGGSGESVMGPVEDPKGCCWTIDARSYGEESFGGEGAPGDQYLVSLRVSGKWRTVTWYKVGFSDEDAKRAADGIYFLSFSSNVSKLKEMTPDPDKPGTHTYEVTLSRDNEYFQIVRNQDWNQVFAPPPGEAPDSQVCFGPEAVSGQGWRLAGKAGDEFKITFTRTVEFGIDRKSISWTKTS
mmetsp:Transcript_81402/g.141295  ORF Transcript_81402/g.141295 Transcript_81402/m.141295 type:complete len:1011 (-) Transcript_81402:40-3072(-)